MDDLDHSMHIAEYDWTSFYDESEECGLLQPSLACPDHSSLSDSEDSGNSSPVFITGQQEQQQQSPDANSEKAKCKAAPWCSEEVQINVSASGGDDPQTRAEKDSDMLVNCEIGQDYPEGNLTNPEEVHVRAAEHITEDTNDDVTLQAEQLNVQSSHSEAAELNRENRDVQTESDTCDLKPIQESDPLSSNQTELNVNEPHSADRAESGDVSCVALRAERERWFVTVNDSPARQRVRAPSGKKKRRQKKPRKDGHVSRTSSQEKSLDRGLNFEMNRDDNGLNGGGDTEENPESVLVAVISDLSQMSSTSGEEDSLSEKLVMPHPPKEIFTLHDTFTNKGPSRFDSLESEDGAEFLSTHSYDSESYLSAVESMDEPQPPLLQNQQLQSSLSLTTNTCLLNLTKNTDAEDTQVREMCSCESSPSSNGASTNSEGYESTGFEPHQTCPSESQSVNKMPDEVSACVNDAHSTPPCMSSDTPGLQKQVNLSASVCSSGDQPSLRSVPDLTVTPCSVADNPETYAEAAGNTRPVYAISAFWDEMEKLTINDILQLRMGRTTSPRETQEAETPNVDDFQTNLSSIVETEEYSLSNSGSLDTSDTADSDYFTQADESKPDRSSCEFSTSDFEEEYWQFLGASRNPSPDPQSKYQRGTGGSTFFEDESTCSEGKETPVPSEDFGRDCFEDQDSDAFSSSELAWPRQITKSKSVRNVQALITEDLSSQVLLGEDDSSLFLSSCLSLEENVALEETDSLGTLIPASFLSSTTMLTEHSHISFPEVFEYLFKDQTKRDSCVTLYGLEDMSLAPVFDCTLCSFRDEMSFSSMRDYQHSDEKPIPIFSCSHPTVRELTFPNPDYVFLSSDFKEDDISPIRVVSHAFILGSDYGASAAALQEFPSLLSIRKIAFHNKGSIWCGSSGAWVFPVEAAKSAIKGAEPTLTVLAKRSISTTPSQMLRELAVEQQILETLQTTRREGIFSALKQSDMCLVCIAFASWVLRSSDPEAADTWKAALLANVSALSAIQYLRQYVKKKPPQGDP